MNGYSWTLNSSVTYKTWISIASSSDGAKLVACSSTNGSPAISGIFTSTDSGLTWTQSTGLATIINWRSVASSSDGINLVVVSDGSTGRSAGIYTSSDSGSTWTPTSAPASNWVSVCSSSNGIKLVACSLGGFIYISSNSGSTWTPTSAPASNWVSVCSSSNGNILLACSQNAIGIYISLDSGITWSKTSASNSSWQSVALNSDGSRLIACSSTTNIGVYISIDYGVTWSKTSAPSATSNKWTSVTSNSSGSLLAAGGQGTTIYSSYDYGTTWKNNTSSSSKWWASIASNSDGTKLAAIARNYSIYTGILITVPSAPTNLVATPSDSSTIITFDQISNGGSAITGYNYSLNDGAYISTSFITSPITITELTNGTPYTISLQAVNAQGTSPASSAVLVTPVKIPDPPIILSAKPADSNATIYFTLPNNGGSSIIDYEYSLNDGEYISSSSNTSPIIITELINDEYYTIKLIALNSIGQSEASNTISFIPKIPQPCFKEGSKILTINGYLPIENLRKGDYVKTLNHGFLPIILIGKKEMFHSNSNFRDKNKLYNCSPSKYQDLFEDLIITGCHSILIDKFDSEDQRQKTKEINGDLFITNNKYRLPACVDERAEIYKISGKYTIYHLALENENYYNNYGIYANGLLVESCSKRYLKELSGMKLID